MTVTRHDYSESEIINTILENITGYVNLTIDIEFFQEVENFLVDQDQDTCVFTKRISKEYFISILSQLHLGDDFILKEISMSVGKGKTKEVSIVVCYKNEIDNLYHSNELFKRSLTRYWMDTL